MEWIKTSDRLPEVNQPVVCIDMDSWENTAEDHDRHIQFCAYLSEYGTQKFWSVYGFGGKVLEAATHWMYIPPPEEDA